MKPLLLLTLFIFSLGVHAQRITTLVLEDAAGLRDTVYFGQQNGATPGIDPALGEVDISSVPMGLSEMRFVSRAPFSCFLDSMLRYRNHTYESKKDVRGGLTGGPYISRGSLNYGISTGQLEENTFHLKVKCTNYPCTLNIVTNGPFEQWYNSLKVNTIDSRSWESNCLIQSSGPNHVISPQRPPVNLGLLAVPNGQSDIHFIMMYMESGTTSLPRSLRELNLRVENQELVAGNELLTPAHVAVVDMLGREQFQQVWPRGQQQLALPALNGIYLVRLRYQDGHTAVVRHRF